MWSDLRDLRDLCCDELVICLVSLELGGFLIQGRPESPNPACCKSWLGSRSCLLIIKKSALKGSVKAEPL